MSYSDPRIAELCDHLRAAVDLLERVMSDPIRPKPDTKPVPERTAPGLAVTETNKLALSIGETSKLLGIGRTAIYAAINEGKIPAVKFGNRTLIPTKGLKDWLDALPSR